MSTTATPAPATLPEPATVEEVAAGLRQAHDAVEQVAWAMHGKVEAATFENVGVVATILSDLEMHLREIAALRDELAGAMQHLVIGATDDA